MFQINNRPKVWAFGDSYTEPFYTQRGLLDTYIYYKGYIPKNYVDLISEHFNYEQFNYAKGGSSNRTILSQFINVIDNISDNDILIFGWTNTGRFRGVINDNFFDIISYDVIGQQSKFDLSEKTITETIFMRNSFIYLSEISEYIKLINRTFQKNKIINWTWVHFNEPSYPNQKNYLDEYRKLLIHQGNIEDIITETNGEIKDYHYSENSHVILANKIIDYIINFK